MRDFDERLRNELSARSEAHQPLDETAFSLRLAERRRKRLRTRAFTVAGAAMLIALGVVAATSLDLAGDPTSLQPAKPRPFEGDVIQVPGGLDRIALDRQSNSVWVLTRRGEIGQLEGDEVRLREKSVRPSQSGWRAFAAGPGETLWVSSGRRLDRLDGSGEVAASTRLTGGGYIQQLDVGSGYVWASDGSGSLFRIDPGTLDHRRVAYMPGQDVDDVLTDHLAAGFGAAWVGTGLAGEVVRVDADTLETTSQPIASPARSAGQVGVNVNAVDAVAVGDAQVWACCADVGDLVALDPRSLEIADRFSFGDGDEGPGGDVQLAYGNDALWTTTSGLHEGVSFQGLLRIRPTGAVSGPFPLPTATVDDDGVSSWTADELVATPTYLLVAGYDHQLGREVLYRFGYSELADLPFPRGPEKSNRLLWIVLGALAGIVILIFYLGREEEPDPAEG